MNLKTILGFLLIAFTLAWIIEDPQGAQHLVHNISAFLSTAASGLSHFVSRII